jgi:hypothetical protein
MLICSPWSEKLDKHRTFAQHVVEGLGVQY